MVTALSNLVPERGALSLVPTSSPPRELEEEDLYLPSSPETFVGAREFIESTLWQLPQTRERPLVVEAPVPGKRMEPSKGKPVMSHQPLPQH